MSDTPIIAHNHTGAPVLCNTQQRGGEAVASIKLLPGESKPVGIPAAQGLWIAFTDLGHHPLASTLANEGVTDATLVQGHISIGLVTRQTPNFPFSIANGTSRPVRAERQLHGSSQIESRELAPETVPGNNWLVDMTEGFLWVGFFALDGTVLGSAQVDAGEFEEVAVVSEEPEFVVHTESRS